MYRLFDTGKREEERIIQDLKAIDVDVFDVDDTTGKKFSFSAFGGHFSGSLDGVVKGLEESPNTAHVLEVKTANKRQFDILSKSCVKDAKPQHWAQMQVYMKGIGLTRAVYICVCKDDDRIYMERVHHDPDAAKALFERAERIIFSTCPPKSECADDCTYCDHKAICHSENLVIMQTCRMCGHAKANRDGGWICDHDNTPITRDRVMFGCKEWCSALLGV